MNFINDRNLALRFRDNAVPSKERFLYFIFSMVLATILTTSIAVAPLYKETINNFDVISDLIYLASVIVGVIACYTTNKNGDGKEFIERMICIGFPVMIITFLISFFASIFYFMITTAFDWHKPADVTTVYDLPPVLFSTLYYYWRLNSSIRIAAGVRREA